ncbi:hypothetical protein A2767_05835 [Candidatus Roizmanbacteria bacterium RIFCSPHIGHO2_01_FULL_35_10]|uniref:Glycosyltransferase 2-like domain-containing protein n=1 Tax=Candidatus Roizmanbacteria bacterium RIFCSPLOWO2_01_FULL_35_13 TaxID=1802055 RepID=A0A1F7I6V6_9BACT|nr:MAG: hypothetical protein A2767_05835 [Candidatus Roizmanbacteria bacterium RIFCSPHIGHO2_01_FULL_35_10]OGK39109.1 MAG: hypothetical protein A3A74_05795 [Candidatus Roizmanbacteria bacterium RIFCSPLOWO2_01_FULL_35_13]
MKNSHLPSFSIIIPTFNSEKVLPLCIESILKQDYPQNKYEIILIDNYSRDKTADLAKKYKLKIFYVNGKPSQACRQRNLGAKKAENDYLFFLDHDMELSVNLLKNLASKIITSKETDAFFIPEKIVANNKILQEIRNYERSFYDATPIDAVRVIKKNVFFKTEKYDPLLSSGPADWDMDIQLQKLGVKFGKIDLPVRHHEENLTFSQYLFKKSRYVRGIKIYKNKWSGDKEIYENIIKKQLGVKYRFLTVFLEKNKFKKILNHPLLFFSVFILKLIFGFIYLIKGIEYELNEK